MNRVTFAVDYVTANMSLGLSIIKTQAEQTATCRTTSYGGLVLARSLHLGSDGVPKGVDITFVDGSWQKFDINCPYFPSSDAEFT